MSAARIVHMHDSFGSRSLCGVIYTKLYDGIEDDGTQVDCPRCLAFVATAKGESVAPAEHFVDALRRLLQQHAAELVADDGADISDDIEIDGHVVTYRFYADLEAEAS